MALLINGDCISCDVCVPECPNEAIAKGDDVYVVDAARCTECVGHCEMAQCVEVCPVDAIVPDPEHVESRTALESKFEHLHA